MAKKKRNIVAVIGHDKSLNVREINLALWATVTDEQKMDAAWELVVEAHKQKGRSINELRFKRSTVFFKPA